MDAVKQKHRAELLTYLMTTLLLAGRVEFDKVDEEFRVTFWPKRAGMACGTYKSSRLEHALEKALRAHTTCYDGDGTR